jgi:carbonic anhydrase
MARKSKVAVASHSKAVDDSRAAKPDPNLVEFSYRYQRDAPSERQAPQERQGGGTSDSVARHLWLRNRLFAEFIADCARPAVPPGSPRERAYDVRIPLVAREVGLVKKPSGFPEQEPFAAILGCVDARAPVELLFAQGFDDLYIARIAGNSLGPDVAGSVHYALHSFAGLDNSSSKGK